MHKEKFIYKLDIQVRHYFQIYNMLINPISNIKDKKFLKDIHLFAK